MKSTPILMSGEMVRARREGRKTQTRRVVKLSGTDDGIGDPMDGKRGDPPWPYRLCDDGQYHKIPSPYGSAGDSLWIRETWRTSFICDDSPPSDMEKPGRGYGWPVWYEADGNVNAHSGGSLPQGGPGFTTKGKLRPSIFMPRWACRDEPTIVSIRVERLQDISGRDIFAEGCPYHIKAYPTMEDLTSWYSELWDSLNAKRGFPWKSNPWVWVIEMSPLKLHA